MCRALEEEGVIEKVNLAEAVDCILNIAIYERKVQGCIRMNIDTRPYNKGAKHTRYHVTTPKEARHKLKGAKIFSEFDMGNGFHHVPLHTDSHVVFQSHLGLHKMKRLFFGPSNSSGIFHHKVTKVFTGLEGCITIHDNLLVYGANEKEHNGNMAAMLEWAKKKGVTLKLSKSTICEPEVKRFGRIFSGAGVSVDPDKILHIVQAGKPESIEDVRSLLQAVAYNTKYGFDHKEDQSYEEVTAPIRKLLTKDAVFRWDEESDARFQTLIRMMNSRTYLAPHDHTRKTHLVTDASPCGIAALLYQEDETGTWVPVDHTSRALSAVEQGWQSQIDWESLAKTWGMMMFRPYLVGVRFMAWGDHKPLLPLYNDMSKTVLVRVTRHRNKVQDLCFTDKYLEGKAMPCDYVSCHAAPIEGLDMEEQERLMVDNGKNI